MNKHALEGQKFGRLRVIRLATPYVRFNRKYARWLCQCECSKETIVHQTALLRSLTQSCGCLAKELLARRSYKHGHATRNGKTTTFSSWTGMFDRCYCKTDARYMDYGGRGIGVSDRWKDFKNFLFDMGVKPSGTSLDRINVNGNYEPGNCRWATTYQQAMNTRRKRIEEFTDSEILAEAKRRKLMTYERTNINRNGNTTACSTT